MYFVIEWQGDYAALMFHDENASEYRAKDPEFTAAVPAQHFAGITFGELQPIDRAYLLTRERANKAVDHFIEHTNKPTWLDYEFVP